MAYTNGMASLGRPPKKPDEKFDKAVRVRMRQVDYDLAEKAAQRAGLSVSGWTRSRLIEAAKRELKRGQ